MDCISRRNFLAAAAATTASLAMAGTGRAEDPRPQGENARLGTDLPLVDYHVHLDQLGLDKAAEIARQRAMKFGIVEHAGTRVHKYPVVLSTDADMDKWIKMLEPKGVYKGIQAEGTDWMGCFSKETIARLDYVLTDAMTIPEKDGKLVHIWKPEEVHIDDPQKWMDRYVDFHVEIMANEPMDILANTTFMPDALSKQYDELWTEKRMQKVIDAAVKFGVALEIAAKYKLPKLPFLKLAKAAGAKFSFGSNARGPEMGALDYCVAMAKEIGLKAADLFVPAAPGNKPIERRARAK